jgi:hypothetical protein
MHLNTATTLRLVRRTTDAKMTGPVDVPPVDSHIATKFQWCAQYRPRLLRSFESQMNAVMAREREIRASERRRVSALRSASPLPAMTCELTGDLEYRSVQIYDPSVLAAPIHARRIGRNAGDILPSDLVELIHAAVHRARQTQQPQQYRWQGSTGRVISPTPDIIAISVTWDEEQPNGTQG